MKFYQPCLWLSAFSVAVVFKIRGNLQKVSFFSKVIYMKVILIIFIPQAEFLKSFLWKLILLSYNTFGPQTPLPLLIPVPCPCPFPQSHSIFSLQKRAGLHETPTKHLFNLPYKVRHLPLRWTSISRFKKVIGSNYLKLFTIFHAQLP